MNNLIGQSLGRYHILEQHGEGGMALVYKAFDMRLERDVAIKIIRSEAFPPEQLEQVLKRFEREAKALARLSHPNIVKVLDYGEHEGAPYLVLEYLPGGTLKGHMGHALPWQQAIKLLLPVARALAYAHQQGIIHRDVKPANVLMTKSGEPMLTDFGIAKILQAGDGQTLTASGLGIGTPDYMAPEQGIGGKIDARADVYALGTVLYELVTGRKPYIADTPMAVLLKHVTDPLPRPTNFAPDLPFFVENVIIKALAKSPEDRYASMEEMVVAFEKLLTETTLQFSHMAEQVPEAPVVESPVEVETIISPLAPVQPPKAQEPEPKREQKSSRSFAWAVLGIVLVGIIALGGWAASRFIPTLLATPTPTLNLSDMPGRYIHPCGAGNQEICLTNENREILKSIRPSLPEGYGQIVDLAWASDGKRVVLSAWRDPNGHENDLFIYHLETGELQRITDRDNNIMPAWSPDGRWIAYHSSGRAMLITPDGSNPKHISAGYDHQVIAASLAWSPDSAWLAWLVREGNELQRLRGLRLYSMRDQSLTFIQFAPGETIEMGYELLWEPYGHYLYLTNSNADTQRFDLTCLQTSCQGLKPEAMKDVVSQKWSHRYYPQWQIAPGAEVFIVPLPAAEQPKPTRRIKIALQAPLSGGLASAGTDIQHAAELALGQLSGPLDEMGFRLELIAFDDQANPEIAAKNARQIVADEAFLCGVGHFNSTATISASEIYHTAGIPFITPTSTNPQVTDRGYLEMNRVVGRDDVQGKVGAQFAQARGFKSVFIVHTEDDYGRGLGEIFRNEAEHLGLQIMEMKAIGDLAATAKTITAKKPDFVFFSGLYDQAGPLFRQIRASGYAGALLGGDGLDSPDLLKLGSSSLLDGEGVFYTSILVNPRSYPQAANFVMDFKEKFKSYPQPFAAPAYDAMGICLKAIENAARAKNGDLPTRREVAEAIRALREYPGITNTFTFNKRGDPLTSKYKVVKVVFPDPERWSENEVIQVLEIAPPGP